MRILCLTLALITLCETHAAAELIEVTMQGEIVSLGSSGVPLRTSLRSGVPVTIQYAFNNHMHEIGIYDGVATRYYLDEPITWEAADYYWEGPGQIKLWTEQYELLTESATMTGEPFRDSHLSGQLKVQTKTAVNLGSPMVLPMEPHTSEMFRAGLSSARMLISFPGMSTSLDSHRARSPKQISAENAAIS